MTFWHRPGSTERFVLAPTGDVRRDFLGNRLSKCVFSWAEQSVQHDRIHLSTANRAHHSVPNDGLNDYSNRRYPVAAWVQDLIDAWKGGPTDRANKMIQHVPPALPRRIIGELVFIEDGLS